MQWRKTAKTLALAGLIAVAWLPFATSANSAPPAAESQADALAKALLLPELLAVMQDEGRAYGDDLEAEFFPGAGGGGWPAQIAAIYDPAQLLPVFHKAFATELTRAGTDIQPMLAFFNAPLGRQIVTLELSARRALLEDAIEAAARQRLDILRIEAPPRLRILEDYIAANHLIDMNVASALNANLAFLRGLGVGGGFGQALTEEELLAQVWSQESDLRAETADWMLMFTILAYAPLEDADIAAYAVFSRTPEGSALNRALFAGFDAAFVHVSSELGKAVGRRMLGTAL